MYKLNPNKFDPHVTVEYDKIHFRARDGIITLSLDHIKNGKLKNILVLKTKNDLLEHLKTFNYNKKRHDSILSHCINKLPMLTLNFKGDNRVSYNLSPNLVSFFNNIKTIIENLHSYYIEAKKSFVDFRNNLINYSLQVDDLINYCKSSHRFRQNNPSSKLFDDVYSGNMNLCLHDIEQYLTLRHRF